MAELREGLAAKVQRARDLLREYGSALVAFSGGADSSLLLKLTLDTLGADHSLAVIATSPIQPEEETCAAQWLAEELGARFFTIESDELERDEFRTNPPDRCYYCKRELFSRLRAIAIENGLAVVVDGSNADDVADYRPGSRALEELNIQSPLKEAGLTKSEIREISRALGLPTWDKPAAACLASRFPYGAEITAKGLIQVAAAERAVREVMGLRQCRVRHHGPVARIEVPADAFALFNDRERVLELVRRIKAAGFAYVALDLEGYRTGALNELLREPEK